MIKISIHLIVLTIIALSHLHKVETQIESMSEIKGNECKVRRKVPSGAVQKVRYDLIPIDLS